ncbi:MAG: YceI family protein [Bacteroidia bacterium]|nr:YceI family protein [Bacteroidia bacterium]MDW8302585.1 YceI family protein [Bacteroidia bacterium]
MTSLIGFIKRIFGGKHAPNAAESKVPNPKVIETNATEWVVDSVHTKINFKVLHMEIAEVVGSFREIEGKVKATLPSLNDLSVELTIPAHTVNTDFPQRDWHIKSPEFLDVEQYPTIKFRSTNVTWKPLKRFTMQGLVTIKGIEKSITFEGQLTNSILKDLTGEPRLGFKVYGKLNRKDFGVNFEMKLENGEQIASEIVEFEADVEITTPQGYEKLKQFLASMGK